MQCCSHSGAVAQCTTEPQHCCPGELWAQGELGCIRLELHQQSIPKAKIQPDLLSSYIHTSAHKPKKYNDSMHVNLNLTHGVCMHACTEPTPMQTPHTRGHAAPAAVEQFTQNSIRSAPNGAKATLTAYKGGGGGKQRIERLQLSESISPALGVRDTTNLARPR